MSNKNKTTLDNNGNVIVEGKTKKPLFRVPVKFTEDAFGFKEGQIKSLDPIVAKHMVTMNRVAVYTDSKLQEAAKKRIAQLDNIAKREEKERKAAAKKEADRLKKLGLKDPVAKANEQFKNRI